MSILGWLFKPKKKMAKPHTKHVKVGKYTLTSHAQNRVAQKDRVMTKTDVLVNLFTKPNGISQIVYKDGRPSYNRVGKKITSSINPTNNFVTTVRPVSRQDRIQFNLVKKGNKNVKRKTNKKNK